MTQETMGHRLKKARESKGLSQFDLAVKTGISISAVRRAEQGESVPRREKFLIIAQTLKVNPAWLDYGEPYAQRDLTVVLEEES